MTGGKGDSADEDSSDDSKADIADSQCADSGDSRPPQEAKQRPSEISATQKRLTEVAGATGIHERLAEMAGTSGIHERLAEMAGTSGIHERLAEMAGTSGIHERLAEMAGTSGIHERLAEMAGTSGIHERLAEIAGTSGIYERLAEIAGTAGIQQRVVDAAGLDTLSARMGRQFAESFAATQADLLRQYENQANLARVQHPNVSVDGDRLWLSLYGTASEPPAEEQVADERVAEEAIPYSDDDIAEIARELIDQMPPDLAPDVMAKMAYCLVMITLMTFWAAAIIAFPWLGAVTLFTGRGPGVVDFHALAQRIETQIETGFAPREESD